MAEKCSDSTDEKPLWDAQILTEVERIERTDEVDTLTLKVLIPRGVLDESAWDMQYPLCWSFRGDLTVGAGEKPMALEVQSAFPNL